MIDLIVFSKTKGTLEVSVSVYLFKENDVYVAYCPSLDLSGYDYTEEAARADFEYTLQEYVKFQMQNETLDKDLMRHGSRPIIFQTHVDPIPEFILRNNPRNLDVSKKAFADWYLGKRKRGKKDQ